MNIAHDVREKRQINPLISLAAVSLVAFVITLVSFFVFWQSSTKDIVQSIQRANQNFDGTPIIATGLDDDGVLSAAELLFIQESLELETNKLTPEIDFGGEVLDKAKIGF